MIAKDQAWTVMARLVMPTMERQDQLIATAKWQPTSVNQQTD